jgi:hypothetical protein
MKAGATPADRYSFVVAPDLAAPRTIGICGR